MWSPVWRSVQARASYAAGETRSSVARPRDVSFSVTHRDDDTYAALAFERHLDQSGSAVLPGSTESGYGFALSHRFGALQVFAEGGRYRRTGSEAERSFLMALERVWGAHALLGTYQQARGGSPTGLPQSRCALAGIGYRYSFSRRTFFIAEAVRVDNRVGNACNFGSNPVAVAPEHDLRGVAAGLRVLF